MKLYKLALLLVLGLVLGCSKNDGDSDDDQKSFDKSGNLLGTGESAGDILTNDTYSNLLLEIAYVKNFKPSNEAIDALKTYLGQHTFKEQIEVLTRELPSPNKSELSIQDIADLETANRTVYNNGETLAVYIYFADAPAEDDDEEEGLVSLGAVYRNTSMVIYESTVMFLAGQSPFIDESDVETVTLNHEFGHLFGLVNLGTTPVNDHEDPNAQHHCSVGGCLMRAELQFNSGGFQKTFGIGNKGVETLQAGCRLSGASVLKILEHKSAKGNDDFAALDPECVLDIQSIGGK